MNRSLTKELARRTVRTVSPEQAPMFDTVADTCLDDPRRAASVARDHDEDLGAGLDIALSVVTPATIYVAMKVVDLMLEWTLPQVGRWSLRVLRRLRGRPVRAPEPASLEELAASLTDERREAVARRAVTAGRELGLDLAETRRIADGILAALREPER